MVTKRGWPQASSRGGTQAWPKVWLWAGGAGWSGRKSDPHCAGSAARVAGQVKEKALAYMERDVLDMIIAIGEKLARREIQRDDNFIISFITAMLREANDTSHLTIRIPAGEGGPSAEQVAEILQDLAENLRVVVDKNLEPGDCVVENEAGVFDGRIRTRLDCIRSSLEMVANGDKPD